MLQATLEQCEQEVAQLIDDGGLGGGVAHGDRGLGVHRSRWDVLDNVVGFVGL